MYGAGPHCMASQIIGRTHVFTVLFELHVEIRQCHAIETVKSSPGTQDTSNPELNPVRFNLMWSDMGHRGGGISRGTELSVVELLVSGPGAEQFGVSTGFDDLSMVDDQNPVG